MNNYTYAQEMASILHHIDNNDKLDKDTYLSYLRHSFKVITGVDFIDELDYEKIIFNTLKYCINTYHPVITSTVSGKNFELYIEKERFKNVIGTSNFILTKVLEGDVTPLLTEKGSEVFVDFLRENVPLEEDLEQNLLLLICYILDRALGVEDKYVDISENCSFKCIDKHLKLFSDTINNDPNRTDCDIAILGITVNCYKEVVRYKAEVGSLDKISDDRLPKILSHIKQINELLDGYEGNLIEDKEMINSLRCGKEHGILLKYTTVEYPMLETRSSSLDVH